jgi:hypothetical protein
LFPKNRLQETYVFQNPMLQLNGILNALYIKRFLYLKGATPFSLPFNEPKPS